MTLPIPLILFLAPFVVVWLLSRDFSDTPGSYLSWSDRDSFWFFAGPIATAVSMMLVAFYYMGLAHGWWSK